MPEPDRRPAYYAARSDGWRDWWTLLHPPYTAWHLSYVVIGASLAPHVDLTRLVATLLAFFAAVGLGAHALDELHGRPLRTRIPSAALVAVTVAGLTAAVALGIVGVARVGWVLVPFIVAGPLLVVAYNAELFGGVVHTDVGFAGRLGCVPVAHRVRRTSRSAGPGGGAGCRRCLRPLLRPAQSQRAGAVAAPPRRSGARIDDAQRRHHSAVGRNGAAGTARTCVAGDVVGAHRAGGCPGRRPSPISAGRSVLAFTRDGRR